VFFPEKKIAANFVGLESCQIFFIRECDWILTLEPVKERIVIPFQDIVPRGGGGPKPSGAAHGGILLRFDNERWREKASKGRLRRRNAFRRRI
jgi:hypothetical protein